MQAAGAHAFGSDEPSVDVPRTSLRHPCATPFVSFLPRQHSSVVSIGTPAAHYRLDSSPHRARRCDAASRCGAVGRLRTGQPRAAFGRRIRRQRTRFASHPRPPREPGDPRRSGHTRRIAASSRRCRCAADPVLIVGIENQPLGHEQQLVTPQGLYSGGPDPMTMRIIGVQETIPIRGSSHSGRKRRRKRRGQQNRRSMRRGARSCET